VHVAEALGGTVEGSYEQEAAAVEVDEEIDGTRGRTRDGGAAGPQPTSGICRNGQWLALVGMQRQMPSTGRIRHQYAPKKKQQKKGKKKDTFFFTQVFSTTAFTLAPPRWIVLTLDR
jgi:hypothetical protein